MKPQSVAGSSATSLEGIAFRACSPQASDLAKTAASSREDPGRFNSSRVGAVYVACDADTAIAELRRTTEREGKSLVDAHPCAILAVSLAVEGIVDLTERASLDAWGLTPDDLTSDDMANCQAAADRIARAGAEGIRWPSAARYGQSIAIFFDQLRPSSRIAVARAFELSCDMLRALERGACTTHLVRDIADLPALKSR
jgi:RES domain-containing protein